MFVKFTLNNRHLYTIGVVKFKSYNSIALTSLKCLPQMCFTTFNNLWTKSYCIPYTDTLNQTTVKKTIFW